MMAKDYGWRDWLVDMLLITGMAWMFANTIWSLQKGAEFSAMWFLGVGLTWATALVKHTARFVK